MKGLAYLNLNKNKESAQCFVDSNRDVLDILSIFTHKDTEQMNEIISYMLDIDEDDFFNLTLSSKGESKADKAKFKVYKDIYMKALQTIFLLHVNQEHETSFAHYTRKNVAEQLLFDNPSDFRLTSTITGNDPKEGKSLLDYLDIDKKLTESVNDESAIKNPYQAFIGCFTFNHNCLNQFRLYGKENGEEATGVSIVVGKDFFNGKANISLKHDDKKLDEASHKHSLYRCIYIDPEMKKVISLGQKDEYAFYVDNPKADPKDISKYQTNINRRLRATEKKLDDLSKMIEKHSDLLNKEIVSELLLPLRYLVKHVAFKEEQECRILDLERLSPDNDKVKYENNGDPRNKYRQLYVNYLQMGEYVEKIYFAPQAHDYELFKNVSARLGHKFGCYKCNHPFAR